MIKESAMYAWPPVYLHAEVTTYDDGLQTVTYHCRTMGDFPRVEARWASSGGFSIETESDMRLEFSGWLSASLSGSGQQSLL